MVTAPLLSYLVALIGLLFVVAGDVSIWTVLVVVGVVIVVERALLALRRLSAGDDASDEPHHQPH